MKIAIVHEWLTTIAGSEKVTAAIAEIFPKADIFAITNSLTPQDAAVFDNREIKTTFIQKLPFSKKKCRAYLPLMPFAIEQLDLSKYDIILSSSHAISKGVITGPDQLHICYCHSPMRYAWDMQAQYLEESGLKEGIKGWIVRFLLYKIRNWDYRSAGGVDHFISNSDYIGRRIKKVYRRESTTIYPNVAIEDFSMQENKEDFYLTASRMVPYKKMDMIARAFSSMPDKKLIIIGDGPQFDKIKKSASSNVTLLGYQPFKVLKDHMQRAKAFVFAAEEDFGIIPVEAQACGTPVIAFGKGGSLETVVHNQTGIFFTEQTEESIRNAVAIFESSFTTNSKMIREHAEKFSTERFKNQFKAFVETKTSEFFSYRSSHE